MLIDLILYKKEEAEKEAGKGDSHIRSIAKSLSWRMVGSVDTILVSWIVCGDITLSFSIGGVELLTKTMLYYFHERIWSKVK